MTHVMIIAEVGVNHNGSTERALALVDAAVAAGADIVKFQSFKAEEVVSSSASTAAYQKTATGSDNQLAMLKALEMGDDMQARVMAHCAASGIEFLSTAFDLQSAQTLVDAGMKRLKIPSGDITALPMIEALARHDRPIILSTGMADMGEVEAAIEAIQTGRDAAGITSALSDDVSLLHCTSNYPTAWEDVNLRAMRTMAEHFQLPVGYSDHTTGIEVPVAAVALGAVVIEKHLTLDRTLPGPDHKASLQPDELTAMVSAIRNVSAALGEGQKAPRPSEMEMRTVARRSLAAARDIPQDTALQADDLTFLRPGDGLPPAMLPRLIGKNTTHAIARGTILRDEDFA